MNKTWSRGDVIGIASFIIAGLTFLASITVPELRRCLGLDTGTCPFWVSTQVPSENLITGTYYAEGTMYNNFTREVVRVSDRTCIRLIDGPANNYEGHETVVVSSLSWRNGSFYIDATNERILDLLQINLTGTPETIHSCTKQQLNCSATHSDDGGCDNAQPGF